MALWGKTDSSALTGTVNFNNTTTMRGVGTTTAFDTELKLGDIIFVSGGNTAPGTTTTDINRFKVAAIVAANNVTLVSTTSGTFAGTLTAQTIFKQASPKNFTESYSGSSIVNNRDMVGVDSTEARVSANRGRGLRTPGWYNFVAGTSGRSGRKTVECLVAMRSMSQTAASDALDDPVAADT